MTPARWWPVAFGLALSAPVLTFGPVFLALQRSVPSAVAAVQRQTGEPAGYVASFSYRHIPALDLLNLLPVFGLLFAWAAPALGLLAWKRARGGRQMLHAGALLLVSVPAVLLTLMW